MLAYLSLFMHLPFHTCQCTRMYVKLLFPFFSSFPPSSPSFPSVWPYLSSYLPPSLPPSLPPYLVVSTRPSGDREGGGEEGRKGRRRGKEEGRKGSRGEGKVSKESPFTLLWPPIGAMKVMVMKVKVMKGCCSWFVGRGMRSCSREAADCQDVRVYWEYILYTFCFT